MENLKIAVVTGAGRKNGLGFGTSEALAKKGYQVVMVARDEQSLDELVRDLKRKSLPIFGFCCDVRNSEQVEELGKFIANKWGYIDVLVNNAGVFTDTEKIEASGNQLAVRCAAITDSFDVNTLGAYRMIETLAPYLKKKGGNIVNVSSGMGQLSEMGAGYIAYRLSKTALNAATKIFSEAFKENGIKVNSVCPGWVRTDMGGPQAQRSLEQGVFGIVWAATLEGDGPTGGFFRDGKKIDW